MMPEAAVWNQASGARVRGGALRREARPKHPLEKWPDFRRLIPFIASRMAGTPEPKQPKKRNLKRRRGWGAYPNRRRRTIEAPHPPPKARSDKSDERAMGMRRTADERSECKLKRRKRQRSGDQRAREERGQLKKRAAATEG